MKASLPLGSIIEKILAILAILATVPLVHPNAVQAQTLENSGKTQALVFEISSKQNQVENAESAQIPAVSLMTLENLKAQDYSYQYQQALTEMVKEYLTNRGSPLADHVELLIEQENRWKILSLANAESGLCKRYPRQTQNCWGVGGARLWDFGDSLDDGIVGMNSFLNNYPRNSAVKYKDMTIDRMNGLYKQPARVHWKINNLAVTRELESLEQRARQLAEARTTNSVAIAVHGEVELAK